MDPAQVAALLGVSPVAIADLGHSHSWTLHRVRLADGREVFVKAARAGGGVFAAEAAGLQWLVEAGPDAPAPTVLAADEHLLILPWLAPDAPNAAAAERFGLGLALVHAASPDGFGAEWDGFIADLPLDNRLSDGPWSQWYARRRLAPYLRLGAEHLTASETRLVERVIEDIDRLAGPPEPPSRIHGDLWSGNVHWSGGRALMIDPAAHGGHRETDLAMLARFGAPYLDRILAGYEEIAPRADGWQHRVPLHQLHALLVHLAMYGAAYRGQIVAAARRCR